MIRIATERDVPEILAIYAPYILTTTYSFEYDVPTEEEFLQRFRAITARFPWLVWEEDGKILGYAYGSAPFERAAYRWCSESSLYLRHEAQGRRIGTRLRSCLESILAYQGYRKVYALVTSENTVSMEFHQKAGYRVCGDFQNCGYKFGRCLGVTWLEKDLNANGFPNNFPTLWVSIIQDDENFSHILDILSLS